MISRTTTSGRRCTAFTVTAALVLSLAVVARLPAAARASAIRSVSVLEPAGRGDVVQLSRNERDSTAAAVVPAATVPAPSGAPAVRRKRTLLKLKPLIVLPAKVALGAGAKIVAGAKLGAKAVGLGTKALGASVVGLKAVKKVAKVTVKAATALGVKAVLLNFLFQKINQVIDFKTRLLSNLDQRNRQQNAQFLSPSKSVGNKDDAKPFVPETPPNFTTAANAPGIITSTPTSGINPGSDLIARPPAPQSFEQASSNFSPAPQDFSPAPQNFSPVPQDFAPASPSSFSSAQSTFESVPPGFASLSPSFGPSGFNTGFSAFAATNDDGSPSLETTF